MARGGTARRKRFGAVFVLLAAYPAAAESVVEVTVSGVRNDRGVVRVSLCTRAEFLGRRCAHEAAAPARRGILVVPLAGVPPGAYAAQAWHDENNNGRLERDALGVPREGVGFSNDPALWLGPPGFGDAAFGVDADGGRASLRLRYFRGQGP